MTDPTDADTTPPPEAPAPPPRREPGRRTGTGRKLAAAGVAAAIALAGFAGGLVVADPHHDAASDWNREGGAEVDLGSLTVDELDEGEFDDGGFGEGEPRPVATFRVRGDDLMANGEAEEVHERASALWGRFAELIPADQREMVGTFELMGSDYQGAHVYPDESDPTRWVLGIGEGLGEDLDATVIHEFGHLLTLQAGQVPPGADTEASCDTYFTGEGCALPSSTFARFVERFWPPEMLEAIERTEAIEDDDEYLDAQERFHAEHAADFVTDYAVTNPGEDLAETFAEFVLRDHPSGATTADEKIRFLWDDPAMTALRRQIRSNLP